MSKKHLRFQQGLSAVVLVAVLVIFYLNTSVTIAAAGFVTTAAGYWFGWFDRGLVQEEGDSD